MNTDWSEVMINEGMSNEEDTKAVLEMCGNQKL